MLVLSEFAGAAQSLGAGAILVNPWNITDMAAAIEDALTMSDQASSVSRPDHLPAYPRLALRMGEACCIPLWKGVLGTREALASSMPESLERSILNLALPSLCHHPCCTGP